MNTRKPTKDRPRPIVGVVLALVIGAGAAGCSGLASEGDAGGPSPPVAPFRVATPPEGQIPSGGFEMSVSQGTQFNDDPLHIGCGWVSGGTYFDEEAQSQREGPHADLTVVVDGKHFDRPLLVRQMSAREGQMIDAAAYRILVEKVYPSGRERSGVVLRIWRRNAGSPGRR